MPALSSAPEVPDVPAVSAPVDWKTLLKHLEAADETKTSPTVGALLVDPFDRTFTRVNVPYAWSPEDSGIAIPHSAVRPLLRRRDDDELSLVPLHSDRTGLWMAAFASKKFDADAPGFVLRGIDITIVGRALIFIGYRVHHGASAVCGYCIDMPARMERGP